LRGTIMVNIQDIQFLRNETGEGIMDCKNALNKANGNLQQHSVKILLSGVSTF